MTATSNSEPNDFTVSGDATNDESIPLLSDNDSIPSLSDVPSMPELCNWFKIKPEIDIVVSYSTAQIQVVDDSTTIIIMKEMIPMIGDTRLFEGDGCQPMLVLG
mgnify:CR=1 FL=1